MTITRVQQNTVASSGMVTSQAITLPIGVTQGNLLVVAIQTGIHPTLPTITPPDASWVQAALNIPVTNAADIQVGIYFLLVDGTHAGGNSWTWTLSALHSTLLAIQEWSAPLGWPASPLDKTAVGNVASPSVGATTIDSGTTATTTQGEELWIAALGYVSGAQTESSITAGWTKDQEVVKTSGTAYTLTMLHEAASSTGAAHCSYAIAVSEQWAGAVATFKDTVALALAVTMAGVGRLSGAISVPLARQLSGSMAGAGALSGVISVPVPGSTYSMSIGGFLANVLKTSLLAKSTVGRRGELSCTVYDVAGAAHYQQYQQCAIYDATGNPAWTGYLTSPAQSQPGFQPMLLTTLTATDQHYLADKRVVSALYRNQTCGYIVSDLWTNILSYEGVTLGSVATGPIVPVANFGYCTVAAALDALVAAASSSGVPWYWMIDQNKKLWFVPYTSVVGPAVDGALIDDGRLSGVVPTVTRANPKYRNTQYAVGGVQQTGTNDETRPGDGVSRAFTFSYALSGVPSVFTLNGAAVTLGIKGQTGYQYYWAAGDPVIAQDSSQALLVSTDRLRMVYIGQVPAVFTDRNAAAIAAQAALDGTSGIVEAVLVDNTLATASDGLAKVNQQLTQYCAQGALLTFATRDTSLALGQLITVTYAPLGLSGAQMLISEVDASDQQDGVNLWFTVNAVQGPYDTSWTDFFGNLFRPNTIANSINLGVSLNVPLAPSTTLAPSDTLAPG